MRRPREGGDRTIREAMEGTAAHVPPEISDDSIFTITIVLLCRYLPAFCHRLVDGGVDVAKMRHLSGARILRPKLNSRE